MEGNKKKRLRETIRPRLDRVDHRRLEDALGLSEERVEPSAIFPSKVPSAQIPVSGAHFDGSISTPSEEPSERRAVILVALLALAVGYMAWNTTIARAETPPTGIAYSDPVVEPASADLGDN